MVGEFIMEEPKKEPGGQTPKKSLSKKQKIVIISGVSVIGIGLILGITLPLVLVPKNQYQSYLAELNKGNYEKARSGFLGLKSYKDSPKLAAVAQAGLDFTAKDYETGIGELVEAGGVATLSFDPNGGTTQNVQTTIKKSKNVTATASKTGYDFSQWQLTSFTLTAKTDDYQASLSFKAGYNATSYAITYDLADGTGDNLPVVYTIEDSLTLAKPTKTGYTFLGWTDEDSTTPVLDYQIAVGTTGDKHLTAHFKANQYTITYDPNGGTMDVTTQVVTYDSPYQLSTTTRTGYYFNDWFQDGAAFATTPTWKVPKDVSLTAHWGANEDTHYLVRHFQQNLEDDRYTLVDTEDLHGVSDSQVTPAVKAYEGFTAPATSSLTINADGSAVLDYYYTRNSYTLTFHLNGGTMATTSLTLRYQASLPDTYTVTRDEDDTFSGWCLDPGLARPFTTMPANDQAIYASYNQETPTSRFEYREDAEGVTLTSFLASKDDEEIVLPKYIDDKKVIGIGPALFEGCSTITKITFDKYLTTIGANAFLNCTGLTSLVIPNTITSIGDDAFKGCVNITSLSLDTASVSGSSAKDGSWWGYPYGLSPTLIQNVTLGNHVTTIGEYAFSGCSDIARLVIPNDVTSVGQYAFQNCASLTSMTLPDSITSLAKGIFSHCTGLKTVQLNIDALTAIGDEAFQGDSSLQEFDLSGLLLTSIGASAFQDCSSLSGTLSLAAQLTSVGALAFSGDTGFTGVVFNCPLSLIGDGAFTGDSNITAYTFNYSLVSCGWDSNHYATFWGTQLGLDASWVQEVEIGPEVRTISAYAFENLPNLTSVTFHEGVTSIAAYAFSADNLSEIILPDSVTTIGIGAFSDNAQCVKVKIGKNVTDIGDNAFDKDPVQDLYLSINPVGESLLNQETNLMEYYWWGKHLGLDAEALQVLHLSETVTSLGDYCFFNCTALESVYCFKEGSYETNNGLGQFATIGEHAFAGDAALTYFSFGTTLTSVGAYSFIDTGLTEAIFPQTTVTIGDYAFQRVDLDHILFPASLTSVGTGAFSNNSALTQVEIPSATTLGENAFGNDSSLFMLFLHADASQMANAFTNDNVGTLYVNGTVQGATENGVSKSYPEILGLNVSKLTTLKLLDDLTVVGDYAFYHCTGLITVTTSTIGGIDLYGVPNLKSIGAYAFSGCTTLPSFNFGSELTTIGEGAFSGCKALYRNNSSMAGIVLPSSLTSLGESCFSGCWKILSISFSSGLTAIPKNAFLNCSLLVSVDFTGATSLLTIGDSAFQNCAIETLTLPASLTSIGELSFSQDYMLRSINFGQCSTIGANAFLGDSVQKITLDFNPSGTSSTNAETSVVTYQWWGTPYGLDGSSITTLSLLDDVTEIGDYAFMGLSALTSVSLFASASKLTSIGVGAFKDDTALSGVVFPSSLTTVKANAFSNDKAITSLVIPATLTTVGDNAFSECGLTSLALASDIAQFGYHAFSNSSVTLTSLTIDVSSVTGTTDGWWGWKTALPVAGTTAVTLTNKLTTIGNYGFYKAPFTQLTLPTSLTSIGIYAFNQSGLTSLVLPSSLQTIGNQAFSSCGSMKSVTINCPVSALTDSVAFNGTPLTTLVLNVSGAVGSLEKGWWGNTFGMSAGTLITLTLGYDCTKVGAYAFYNCTGLTSLTILSSILDIADYAFMNDTALTTLDMAATRSIGNYCFAGCTGLKTVSLPSATIIQGYAFKGDSALTSVTYPNAFTIGDYAFDSTKVTSAVLPASLQGLGFNPWANVTTLTTVTSNNSAFAFDSSTSCLTSVFLTGRRLILCIGTTLVYSKSFLYVDPGAFSYGKTLTSVTFESGVTAIPDKLFWTADGSTKVTSVTLPNTLVSIGSYAFANVGLTGSITLPETTTTIGDYAFLGNKNLTGFFISSKVSSIGQNPWGNCDSLALTIHSDNTSFAVSFLGSNSSTLLFTADHKRLIYVNSAIEGTIDFTATLITGMVSLDGYAFSDCSKLTAVTLLATVTTLGESAFANCTALSGAITIPSGVTAIPVSCFYGCTHITSVSMPDGVTSIGLKAFSHCSSLTTFNFPASLTTIGEYAFSDDTAIAMTTFNLPSSLHVLPKHCFESCGSTSFGTKITINATTLTIDDYCFYGTYGIDTTIIYATSLTLGYRCITMSATTSRSHIAYHNGHNNYDGLSYNSEWWFRGSLSSGSCSIGLQDE
jgi:uncharacterized repeat protein (TIGR02543 family)